MSSPIPMRLDENLTTVLDENGNGSVSYQPLRGPRNGGYYESVEYVAESVAPVPPNTVPINQASVSVYVSYGILSAGPTDLVGSYPLGSSGATCGVGANIQFGDWLTVAWTNGDVGALATAKIAGTVTVPTLPTVPTK